MAGSKMLSFLALGRGKLPSLFDHFVSACEQRGRDREAEGLGGFEVDDHIVFGVLLDGEVNRLGGP